MSLDVILALKGGTICMGRDLDAIHALVGRRFELVVFCAKESGPPPQALAETKTARAHRAAVYHCPLRNAALTKDEVFVASRAADLIAGSFLKGREVLVTCPAGGDRSALVVALTLHFLSGEGGAAALRAVRERKQQRASGPVLQNPSYVSLLEGIAPKLDGGPKAVSLGSPKEGSRLILP